MIESLFIIVLLILSNYTDKTLPSNVNKNVTNDIYLKQIIVLVLIYYSVKQWGTEINHNLPEKIGLSFIIWIGYLMIIKCKMNIVSICIGILFCLFLINDVILYIEHHLMTENSVYTDYYLPIIHSTYNVLIGLLVLVLLYGVITSGYKFKHNSILHNLVDHR